MINTNLIIRQIFARDRRALQLDALAGGDRHPANIAISDKPLKTRFFELHFTWGNVSVYLKQLLRSVIFADFLEC